MKMIPAGQKSPAGIVFSIPLYVSALRTRWRSAGAKRDKDAFSLIQWIFVSFINVYRDYRVHIDFNIDFDQFQFGLDCRREEEEKPA